jgi:acyl carrier protein
MTREEVLAGIKEILTTVNQIDHNKISTITEETDFITDLNAPSAELINIIAKAESKFEVEFDDDDIDDIGSKVSDTIDLVLKAKANS